MTDANNSGRNWLPLLGFLAAGAAIGINFVAFNMPVGPIGVWSSLALAVLALVLLFLGVARAFRTGRGKILSSLVGVVTLLACALSLFGFWSARKLPSSSAAPQVGQKAPDFTMTDSTGKQVSLVQLLVAPLPNGASPKATLLVFYRGYW